MKDISEAIRERRAAVTRLQAELEVLERAQTLLNGGASQAALPLALVATEKVIARRSRGHSVPIHPMKGKVNPKSSTGQAVAVLREAGVELHILELLARMKKRGAEAKKTSLVSTLMKLAKRGQIFFKADQPSTFGLLEWKQAKTATAAP